MAQQPERGAFNKTGFCFVVFGYLGPQTTQLPKADLLTFWFSSFGPFLVKAPKGDHLLFPFFFGQ